MDSVNSASQECVPPSFDYLVEDKLREECGVFGIFDHPDASALTVLGLHASRSYLEARGMPRSLADLQQHALIGFDRQPSVSRGLKLPMPLRRELFAYRCDSDLGQLAAIRAGFGIGVCQYGVAASSSPPLVSILPQAFRFELEIWIVMHEALRKTARIRSMFDHLVTHFTQYAARSTGPPR